VTSLIVEHFGVPSSPRDARAFELTGRRATDYLAGRTVWCASGLPRARGLVAALVERFEWVSDEGVSTGRIEVQGREPLLELAGRLDEMLRAGARDDPGLGATEREVYAEGVDSGEVFVGDQVRPDDVVVVHDPLSAALAAAIRERGAHAVWHVTISSGRAAQAARDFIRRYTDSIDAYVMTVRRPVGRGLVEERMAALMPRADVVAALELGAEDPRDQEHRSRTEEVGWSALLADVISGDRRQTVGGTRHVRPTVAAR
jgi:trehalose synthase